MDTDGGTNTETIRSRKRKTTNKGAKHSQSPSIPANGDKVKSNNDKRQASEENLPGKRRTSLPIKSIPCTPPTTHPKIPEKQEKQIRFITKTISS